MTYTDVFGKGRQQTDGTLYVVNFGYGGQGVELFDHGGQRFVGGEASKTYQGALRVTHVMHLLLACRASHVVKHGWQVVSSHLVPAGKKINEVDILKLQNMFHYRLYSLQLPMSNVPFACGGYIIYRFFLNLWM